MTEWITAYHGTNDLRAVLAKGLEPTVDFNTDGFYIEKVVYMTTDIKEALQYAESYMFWHGMRGGGIIKVRIPKDWLFDIRRGRRYTHMELEDREMGVMPTHPPPKHKWFVATKKIPPEYIVEAYPLVGRF